MTNTHDRNAHSLTGLAGYSVRQTIVAGMAIEPLELKRFAGAGAYIEALDYAREWRRFDAEPTAEMTRTWSGIASFAVVCPIYADGCVGEPF